MAKRPQKRRKSQTNVQELVIVAFAEDLEQAKDYKTLLQANDIPSTIKEQTEDSTEAQGFAVMVPEDFLDEAHVVIESQDAYDDFYDIAIEDQDDDSFDSDLFGDDL